ncbi:unnamed protein product [Paramecium pentaurelia]|uniref:Protein kinase domain-containing protein n=1 Tax=Paramecium pentaurelia TaxID=43138 RepID=A0A8S1VKD3_9CILI|nr:unnamed protein product [Paramecium pentaurelia]
MLSNPKVLVNSVIQAPNNNYPNRSFVLEKLIGQGSEGCVYLGKVFKWNNQVNEKIAIKLQQNMKQDEIYFLQSLIQTQNQYEQTNNPKLLNKIQQTSSNIIRIYETFSWKDCNVILMELGVQNLELYIQSQQQQPLQNKLQIMKQLTQAIQFLHLNGLIHRDIKPENFIQVGSQFKLIDFGLVRQNNNIRLKTIQVGTPLYCSPEIFEESNSYTQSVDIWSLACVFYEIIEAYPLISGNTIEQVKNNVLNHKYQQDGIYIKIDILEIPNQLKILLKQMLAPSPEKRCSIDQVLDQLINIIEKETQSLIQNNNQRINEKKDNQQQKFMNFSPVPKNKTDQNFFIQQNQQNQINSNQLIPIQNFQPFQINNQQNDIQNQLKSGISQIQQILGIQVKQAQEQNKDLIEQIKCLTQQNKSLIEQTEKNQQQIDNLQKKLFDKQKDDQRFITSNQSNKKQCNCDLENRQLLIELQKLIEKESQLSLEQMKKVNLDYNQQIDKIQINLKEIKQLNNDQNIYAEKYQQNISKYFNEYSSKILGKIENSEHQIQQSIQSLKQMIQTQLSQNPQKGKTQNDEFNVTSKNQNENYQIIINDIQYINSQLNNKLIDVLQKQMERIINSVKQDLEKNFQKFVEKVEQISGRFNEQNRIMNQVPKTIDIKNETNHQQPQQNKEQNQNQNSRFKISQQTSNKQEQHYYQNQ